jgi:hypothetical protein
MNENKKLRKTAVTQFSALYSAVDADFFSYRPESDSVQRTARSVHPAMHIPLPSAKPCPPSGPISSRQGMECFSSAAASIRE